MDASPPSPRSLHAAALREARTKIVATLGPATRDETVLRGLFLAGVNVVRLNFSHGTHAEHAAQLAAVRRIADELHLFIAVMLDLQGPKIRIGALADGKPVTLVPGATVTIVPGAFVGTATRLSTTYADLPNDVHPGDRILLDDGLMELRVTGVEGGEVITTVGIGGELGERKGINLPGVAVSTPALTAKDRDDLAFGVSLGVDYVALSFVRRAHDLREARAELRRLHADIPLIAKIEKPEALDDLPGVLDAADGVMVARGDLGVELSPEQVPAVQKRIIQLANARGILVITATEMLQSMVTNPRPTRAEASDVFNAILDGTDAVALSGETAVGRYPVAAVAVMRRIALQAEAALIGHLPRVPPRSDPHIHAIVVAACTLATQVKARALVVFTRTGRTAHLVSNLRCPVPVLAVTEHAAVARRLALWWGLHSVLAHFEERTDATVTAAEDALVAAGLLATGDVIVIVSAATNMQQANANLIKLDVVGSSR